MRKEDVGTAVGSRAANEEAAAGVADPGVDRGGTFRTGLCSTHSNCRCQAAARGSYVGDLCVFPAKGVQPTRRLWITGTEMDG